MPLTESDQFRINILLTQKPQAIKISESRMLLSALTDAGEARIELHANCRQEQYLKQVREFLSTHVLGSPGGYPIFLRRWTRMGQARDESLNRLLLLGEEEAVTAVVHAPGLNLEIARRAWWILPSAENARRMLLIDSVAESDLGRELADFLLEFLPFEQDQLAMINSVRLVLKVGVSPEQTQDLWKKAARKTSFYIGFMQAMPDQLPAVPLAPGHVVLERLLNNESLPNEPVMYELLMRVASRAGQTYLQTAKRVLAKPNNQDVVVSLLNTLGGYFEPLNTQNRRYRDMAMWHEHAQQLAQSEDTEATTIADELQHFRVSALALSMVDETMVSPVFAVSDAIGSVMRKRIKPVIEPIVHHIDRLLLS